MLSESNLNALADLPMTRSDAKGVALLHDGERFGADIIEFPPVGEIGTHKHPGAHMLFVLAGSGTVIRDGATRPLSPGDCYLVASDQPHSVHAGEDGLRLLVVGNDHRSVDSEERLYVD